MDRNDIELNCWMDEQDAAESPAAICEANQRLERQRNMVEVYASNLLAGQELQVGSRIARRSEILSEAIHDYRIKPAMLAWREGDKLPIQDVIHRAAGVICARALGWDLIELGLIHNRVAKMPSREECESYEMPLSALIDSHIKRKPVGTATAILQAEINGELEEFMARGETMLEADTKAQKLRSTALAKAYLAAVSEQVKAAAQPI